MARLHTIAGELGSAANGMEWYNQNYVGSILDYSSAIKHSGDGAYRLTGLVSGAPKLVLHRITVGGAAAITDGVGLWMRGYIRVDTLPSGANTVFGFTNNDTSLNASNARVQLNADGTFGVIVNNGGQLLALGTTSYVISTGVWYRLELYQKRHATTPNAALDEVTFRLSDDSDVLLESISNLSTSIVGAARCIAFGGNGENAAQTQGDWYFDDVCVNDSTGSDQNSWPGPEWCLRLDVDAAGEFAQTLTLTGGATAQATQMEAPSPDDATSYYSMATNTTNWTGTGSRSMLSLENLPVTPPVIKVVHVGMRFSNNSASGSNFELGTQIANGGTKDTFLHGNFASQVGTWISIMAGAERNYRHTRYVAPNAAAWTEALVNSLQVGTRVTDGSPAVLISKLWALVCITPPVTALQYTRNRRHPMLTHLAR